MLATNAGLLTPILGDPSPWNPERLYINGEAGAWYDPGDLTAEKVAWRRNLYLYSEPASATGYTANNVAFGTIAQFSFLPSGGNGVTLADSTVSRSLTQSFALTAGITYTLSFYVYVGAGVLPNQGSGTYRDFTITRNNDDVTNYALINYEAVGGGVYRVTHSWLHTGLNPTVVVRKYGGLSTATRVDFSGLQLEVGTTASAYQRITDFTSDFLAAFPTHALYQDAAGTTPVTALGQPVGLALDKSRGGLANVGADIVVNGDFTSSTGWLTPGNWTISGGAANANGVGYIYRTLSALAGYRLFRVQYDVLSYTSGTVQAYMHNGTSAVFGAAIGRTGRIVQLIAHTGASELGFLANSFVGSVDNLSIREVPGVHAIQPTSASRPALDARANLLTYSEQFDNAIWSVQGSTVTANSTVAPDGTTTADTLIETATTEDHNRFQGISAVGGAPYRGSVYLKKGLSDWAALYIVNGTTGNGVRVWFNISTGTVGTSANISSGLAGVSFTIEAAANGYYRCFLTATADGSTSLFRFYVALARSDGGAPSYAGDITYNMAAWGADLRLATDAAYPYQRVVTATDYADVGVPRSFLHDGFDDSSYTASSLDLSGTDKVTVWAGVYKNSDAAFGVLAELTANAGSNNGGLAVIAPGNSPTRYQWVSRGTAAASAVTSSASFSAPHSAVVSGVGDIAADVCALRINGAQVATDSTDQGTGNYANAVLYMGRRNNTSNPLNGKVYCIIIRGGVTDAATLALTERYVGSRMGIVL